MSVPADAAALLTAAAPRRLDALVAVGTFAHLAGNTSESRDLKPFYDWMHANYVPAGTVGPKQWVVYRRATGAAARSPGPIDGFHR
ncbi:MAG: hypothetical protein H0X13_10340 [Ramlibacter sp.]|nr:hypothetical protein [Ramlibacter sp.]